MYMQCTRPDHKLQKIELWSFFSFNLFEGTYVTLCSCAQFVILSSNKEKGSFRQQWIGWQSINAQIVFSSLFDIPLHSKENFKIHDSVFLLFSDI